MKNPAPKIRGLHVRAVRVPMEQPHQTASGTISESPLVLTDVTTEDGTVGLRSAQDDVGRLVVVGCIVHRALADRPLSPVY